MVHTLNSISLPSWRAITSLEKVRRQRQNLVRRHWHFNTLIGNYIHVPCLNKCQFKKLFTFYIENPKLHCLSFDEYVMSHCKILRGKNLFPITFISVSSILRKTISKGISKYDYGFSLCCNSGSHLKTSFKNIYRILVEILEKSLWSSVKFSLKSNFVTVIFQVNCVNFSCLSSLDAWVEVMLML